MCFAESLWHDQVPNAITHWGRASPVTALFLTHLRLTRDSKNFDVSVCEHVRGCACV